jgi:hypothetical protein
MTNERIPNDPYRPGLNEDYRDRPQRFDEDLQVDPELGEGPASRGKVALFAICIALVLGAVFYGLNNTSVKEASTQPPAQTAQTQPATPQASPSAPKTNESKANTEPGQTTGAATNRPSPPASSPAGPEVDRSKQQ